MGRKFLFITKDQTSSPTCMATFPPNALRSCSSMPPRSPDLAMPLARRSGRRPPLCIVALVALLTVLGGCERLVDRQIEKALTRTDTAILDAPGLHVVLCGTGSPLPDAQRAGACTAVIAGGELVLVDVGPGSAEAADLANLPTGALSAVLLTHFHSDHIGDLGEAMTQSWIAGRSRMLDVYGPPGTSQIVNGFNQAYAADAQYRTAHHGEEFMPAAAATALAHDVPLDDAADAEAAVFERNGLRVTMFRVHHDPVTPAVGYRFDYRGRSVVVSGDTAKSANLLAHAKGADILIHEGLQPDMIGRAAAVADRIGKHRIAKMARDTLTYHTAPVEAAEIARDAGVGMLVFTHLVPGPSNFLARRMFLAGVADVYPGPVVLGEDGMRFDLEPKS
jgi:ribonuclease Z